MTTSFLVSYYKYKYVDMATKIKDIIDYYSGHEVSDEMRERVMDRISRSQDDEEANEALRELWDKADTAYMEESQVSEAYGCLFESKIKSESSDAGRLRLVRLMKIAAVIIPLLVMVVFGKLYFQTSSQLKNAWLASMQQEHTINGESREIALADGTKVRLCQSSVLLYPSSFSGAGERKVFLSGEAFFDIKHDDSQPFHVSTPHFEITDLGTSFTVSSYTDADEVSATLKSGKIELRIVGQEDKVYSMNPDDRLVYNVATKAVKIQRVAAEDDGLSWRNKEIDLNDVTLQEATKILGEAYGVRFTFRSARHQNTKVTVHFNRGETLEGAMSIIRNLVHGLEYEIRGDEVIVK